MSAGKLSLVYLYFVHGKMAVMRQTEVQRSQDEVSTRLHLTTLTPSPSPATGEGSTCSAWKGFVGLERVAELSSM
jgi:hypothetical protein